jgi:DNA-binding MarR family transcriptional regulator
MTSEDVTMQQVHTGPLPPGAERQEFLERQPTYWLKRCYQSLRRTVDGALREYGLTLSQRDVLLTLYEEGPMDQGALRERLGLEQSSVSRLVDGLTRRGLVEVRPGADRRVRFAEISESGRDLLLQTPGASALGGRQMVSTLSAEERRELVRLLKVCTENLEGRPEDSVTQATEPLDGAGRTARYGGTG